MWLPQGRMGSCGAVVRHACLSAYTSQQECHAHGLHMRRCMVCMREHTLNMQMGSQHVDEYLLTVEYGASQAWRRTGASAGGPTARSWCRWASRRLRWAPNSERASCWTSRWLASQHLPPLTNRSALCCCPPRAMTQSLGIVRAVHPTHSLSLGLWQHQCRTRKSSAPGMHA